MIKIWFSDEYGEIEGLTIEDIFKEIKKLKYKVELEKEFTKLKDGSILCNSEFVILTILLIGQYLKIAQKLLMV